jgi:hypothetical protein
MLARLHLAYSSRPTRRARPVAAAVARPSGHCPGGLQTPTHPTVHSAAPGLGALAPARKGPDIGGEDPGRTHTNQHN